MVERKEWFFLSYVSAFLSVYLMSIGYPVIATSFQASVPMNAYTMSANATVVGLVGVNNMGSWFPTIALVLIACVVIGVITSYFSMGRGLLE